MIDACVLAAGRGSRMGGAKHLLALDGVPMLEHVVRAIARTRVARVSVVLAPGDTDGQALVTRLGVPFLTAESADEGRAASIRAAVRATRDDAEALLVALADQPFLAPQDYDALLVEFLRGEGSIVRARYAGEPGTPVLFAREHFPALLKLEGRDGGRRVIAANPERLRLVDLDPERGRDLDAPEDLPVPRSSR